MEVFIHLDDIIFADDIECKLSKKYIVWNIPNKQNFCQLLQNDICKDKDGRFIIIDRRDAYLINKDDIPYNYNIIMLSEESFDDSIKYSDLNISWLKYLINMAIKKDTYNNSINSMSKFLTSKYQDKKSKLIPPLRKWYDIVLMDFNKYKFLLLTGSKGVGKSYFAKLLSENKIYNVLYGDNTQIEEIIFGIGANRGLLDDGNTIIIERADKLPLRVVNQLATFCWSRQYSRLGDSRNLTSDTKIIFISDKDPKELKKILIPLWRISIRTYVLPSVNTYSYNEKIEIVKTFSSKPLFFKPEIEYNINKYPYSYNLYELMDIANYLSKLNTNTVSINTLPFWITNIDSTDLSATNLYLRQIIDQEIYNLKDAEKLIVQAALEKTSYKKKPAARLLGVTPTTLRKKIDDHHIIIDDMMDKKIV